MWGKYDVVFCCKKMRLLLVFSNLYVYLRNKNYLGMERIHSAKELFLKTLINMGIKYETHNYEDTIWFDFQDMDFEAEEDKEGKYITLEYMD